MAADEVIERFPTTFKYLTDLLNISIKQGDAIIMAAATPGWFLCNSLRQNPCARSIAIAMTGVGARWPPVLLLGAGTLGRALLPGEYRQPLSNQTQVPPRPFRVVALFDSDPLKVGHHVGLNDSRIVVRSVHDLTPRMVSSFHCSTAVLAVPHDDAQAAADVCVRSGVTRILNYSSAALNVPAHVDVRSVWSTLHFDQEAEADRFGSTTFESSRWLREFDAIKLLGRGGFGYVFGATHRNDATRYAVKVLPARSEMLSEVRILASVLHENIVRYHTCWVEPLSRSLESTLEKANRSIWNSWSFSSDVRDSTELPTKESTNEDDSSTSGLRCGADALFIQMAFVDGSTLSTWLRSRKVVNPVESLRIFRQLADAVCHLHQQMIAHGDLKPDNILMRSDGDAVIIDFGLAIDTRQRQFSKVAETAYACPEGIRSTAADIFALGLILFELFSCFATVMERAIALSSARAGNLKANLSPQLDLISQKISHMTSAGANNRPTARDIVDWLSSVKVISLHQ